MYRNKHILYVLTLLLIQTIYFSKSNAEVNDSINFHSDLSFKIDSADDYGLKKVKVDYDAKVDRFKINWPENYKPKIQIYESDILPLDVCTDYISNIAKAKTSQNDKLEIIRNTSESKVILFKYQGIEEDKVFLKLLKKAATEKNIIFSSSKFISNFPKLIFSNPDTYKISIEYNDNAVSKLLDSTLVSTNNELNRMISTLDDINNNNQYLANTKHFDLLCDLANNRIKIKIIYFKDSHIESNYYPNFTVQQIKDINSDISKVYSAFDQTTLGYISKLDNIYKSTIAGFTLFETINKVKPFNLDALGIHNLIVLSNKLITEKKDQLPSELTDDQIASVISSTSTEKKINVEYVETTAELSLVEIITNVDKIKR